METIHRKLPTHELVYREIREMILFGELLPGQPVTIQGLVKTLDVGMTPVREAMRRLTAEGALEFLGNRRACVPELTLSQLDELYFARKCIESELTYLAINKMTAQDIEAIAQIDSSLNKAISSGDVRTYLEQNYRFHNSIYRLSGANILLSISESLWLRFGPSLRVVCGQIGTFNLPDKHNEALNAMRAGDAKAAAQAISDDLKQGHEQIRHSLSNSSDMIKID